MGEPTPAPEGRALGGLPLPGPRTRRRTTTATTTSAATAAADVMRDDLEGLRRRRPPVAGTAAWGCALAASTCTVEGAPGGTFVAVVDDATGPLPDARGDACGDRPWYSAAPIATSCLGWVSIPMRTWNSACNIWLTKGMRELPPTRTTALSRSTSVRDERRARRVAATVDSSAGPIRTSSSALVMRTETGPQRGRREHRPRHRSRALPWPPRTRAAAEPART